MKYVYCEKNVVHTFLAQSPGGKSERAFLTNPSARLKRLFAYWRNRTLKVVKL